MSLLVCLQVRRAAMVSPLFPAATNAYVSFAYRMYGAISGGDFSLELQVLSGRWWRIWSRTGNQGGWHQEKIPLPSATYALRFVLVETEDGRVFRRDVAVDAIAVYHLEAAISPLVSVYAAVDRNCAVQFPSGQLKCRLAWVL